MADDKRFGADSFEDDAVRGDADAGAVGSGDEDDAALGQSTTDAVGPERPGAGADPIASELSAVFAALLADEPPSRVTPESVLREVHGEKRGLRGGFGTWLASGPLSLKWAGGLAVAAALIGAVIVTAPNMVGSGADSAAVAGAQRYESAAGNGGSDSASSSEQIAAADSAASMAAPEAAPMSAMTEMSASSESSQAAADAGEYAGQSEAASGDAADSDTGGAVGGERQPGSDQRSAESSSESPTGGDTAAASSSGTDCSIPPLEPEAWSAAVAALPSDVTTTRLVGASCAAGALRGNGIEVVRGGEQSGTFLWIVVSDGPIGRDGAATDSTVVSASRGDETVTVIANQNGDPWLDESALQRLVDAVADAAG